MAAVLDHIPRRRHVDRVNLAQAGRLEDTPQGYLWCRDVPLARTGTMEYSPLEVPIPAARGQRFVTVERTEDEVFSPQAIESFRGMPFTDDHPAEDVTSKNWKDHRIGDIHNPRRGEGEHADCLVGDLLVVDPEVIDKIKSGRKRQLSCGYDAEYTDVRPGYGRQINIRGNHVSLVDAGRAGSRIKILDKLLNMADPKPKRPRLRDSIISLFRAKDEAEREEIIKQMEGEGEPKPEGDDAHKGDGHHITLNIHGAPSGAAPTADAPSAPPAPPPPPRDEAGDTPPPPEAGKDMDEDKIKELCGGVVAEALGPMTAAMQALAEKVEAMGATSAATAEQVAAVAEAVEDMTDPEDMATQDAVARAEVLKPGVTLPNMDAKPGSKGHKDALVSFQRKVLGEAFASDETAREAIRDAYGMATPDFKKMLPAEVGIVFRAASSAVAAARDAAAAPASFTFAPAHFDGAKGKATDPASINKKNRERWGR